MPNIIQDIVAPQELKQLTLPVIAAQLPGTSYPTAQLIHTEDSVTIDAPGAGNTGTVRVRMDLPRNWAWSLQRFVATMRGGSNTWADAWLELYYGTDDTVPAGSTTQLDYPIGTRDLAAPDTTRRHYWIGSPGDDAPTGQSQMSDPDILIYGYPGTSVQPTFGIGNDTVGVTSTYTMSYLAIWNGYPLEQVLAAGMHMGVPAVGR